jgi:hypothetical protein
MKEEILNLKKKIQDYIDNIGRKYIKGKAIVQQDGKINVNKIKMEILNNHKALPVLINNYMLDKYKDDAKTEFDNTFALLSNAVSDEQRNVLITALSQVTQNQRTINDVIVKYQQESKELDKDMRSSLGIIPVVIPKINNKSKK